MAVTMLRAPERSVEQRREALREANRIRVKRAAGKRDLKVGRLDVGRVLDDDDWATAKVIDVLLALPRVGRVRVNRWLTVMRISPSKSVGGLTGRQRAELLVLVGSVARGGAVR